MATRPQDLTVAKSDVAADTIASAIHDMTETMDIGSASDASKRRMLRKHARELVALHDELSATEIFAPRGTTTENGHGPFPGTIPVTGPLAHNES